MIKIGEKELYAISRLTFLSGERITLKALPNRHLKLFAEHITCRVRALTQIRNVQRAVQLSNPARRPLVESDIILDGIYGQRSAHVFTDMQ